MRDILFIAIICAISSFASLPGTWETFTNANYSNDIAAFDGKIYVATNGGIVVYTPGAGTTNIMTNLEGLGGLTITALQVHDGGLYCASSNGALGKLSKASWLSNSELVRANIGVNDLTSAAGRFYAATTQGISKLRIVADDIEIAENYTKLGSQPRNAPTYCITADDSILWAGMENGIARGRISDNLFVPEVWRIIPTSRPVTGILADSGGVWFSLERAVGEPTIFFTKGTTIDTIRDTYMNERYIDGFFYHNGRLHAVGKSGVYVLVARNDFDPIRLAEHWAAHGGTTLNDTLYVGLEIGFGYLERDTIRPRKPNCPQGSGFTDVTFTPDGAAWVAAKSTGVNRYKDGVWTAYSNITISPVDSLSSLVRTSIGSVAAIAADADGSIWIGTNNSGILRRFPNGSWVVYNRTNSVLWGIPGADDVVVCRAMVFDEERNVMWVSNYSASTALAVAAFDRGEGLSDPIVSYYSGTSAIPVNYIHGLATGKGRVWMVILDEGVVMLDPGVALSSNADDFLRLYSETLPSASAFQVAVDSLGRAWVAADGGVAAIDPTLNIVLSYMLPENVSSGARDVAVDAWNNVWVTTDDGIAMFRSSDTSWHALKSRQSANAAPNERSDLAVDNLYSVAVNPITGDVWFAGEGAICVFHAGYGNPDDEVAELGAYPNPFIWRGDATERLTITGVPPDADLAIFSADGSLVRTISLSERGPAGTAIWNGRNEAGRPVASGIYIFVAPSDGGVAKGKAALIRGDE